MIWAIKDKEKIKSTPKGTAVCPICKSKVIAKCGVVKSWHWSHKSVNDCDNWAEPESAWHLKWKSYFPKEQQEVIIENHRADIKTKGDIVIELQNSSISADDICDREKFYNKMIWLLNGNTFGNNLKIINKKSYFIFEWKNPPKSFFYSNDLIYIDIEEKVKENEELIKDCYERVNKVFYHLKDLIGENPKQYDWTKFVFDFQDQEERDKIKEIHNLWEELSCESRYLELIKKKYNKKTIFIIKKLYKNIPCKGWGYLITKKEFLDRYGGIKNGKE